MDLFAVVENMKEKYGFHPGMEYPIYRKVPNEGARSQDAVVQRPDVLDVPDSLVGQDAHWAIVNGVSFSIPLQQKGTTGLLELKTKDDFVDWFQEQYSKLDNGIYSSFNVSSEGNIQTPFFLLAFEDGDVNDWKVKTEGTPYHDPATFLVLPYFFKARDAEDI